MSDSGITDDDCIKSDSMNNLMKKSATQSPSIDSPPSIGKDGELAKGGLLSDTIGSGSISPLLDTATLPSEDLHISECPYCNKNYRKPRVLDCLHSLCEDCIIAQLDGRIDNKKESLISSSDLYQELEQPNNHIRPTPPGVIRCPICYQESHVGNDVRFVNFMLLDFIRIREADYTNLDKNDRICRACKGDQPAVAACRHCCSDICKNCVQAHRDMKMFDGHKVVLFTESDAEPQVNGASALVDVALCVHHQVQYSLICISCDELICQHCYSEHKTHNCRQLNEEVFSYYSSKLRQLMDQVEAKSKSTTEARSLIPDRLSDLNTAFERCRAKIELAFDLYAKALEETKQKIFADLEQKKDEQEDNFNNLYQKIDLQSARLQDAVSFTSRLLEKGTVVELCASRKKVWQQLQNLLHGMPEVNSEIDMDFDIPKEQDFRTKLEQLVGTVECRVIFVPTKDEKLLATLNTAPGDGGEPIYSVNRVPSVARGWDVNDINNQITIPISSLTFDAVRTPGAIGMERRQTRGSVGLNLGNTMDPMFNHQPLVPSPPNPQIGNPNDIYSIGLVNNSTRINSSFNPTTPTTNNFGKIPSIDSFVQNKPWTTFNPPNMASQFDIDSMMRQRSIDPRFPGQPDFGFDIFSSNRSSVCTTPSFEAMPQFGNSNMVHDNKNMGFMGPLGLGRMPNTIEMSIHATIGSSNGGIDMLQTPQGICLGLDDEIVVCDTNNHRCVVFNTSGKMLRQFGQAPGTEEGSLYYPRKVVSIIGNRECRFIVLDRGNANGNVHPNRFSMFDGSGEFLFRLLPVTTQSNDQINTFAWHKDTAHLITVDCKSNLVVYDLSESPLIKPIAIFSVSTHVQEASDVAIYKNHYFITDYKTHSIVVYNIEGKFIHKFGNINLTPFPIGIDISKSGDILIGDSHGNHYHIVVFNSNGKPQQDYKCMSLKVSRCTGLKITTDGLIVTMSRQTNTVLVFNTLYMPPMPPSIM